MASQLLARAQAVGRPGPEPGVHLVLEPGHPDLEELVQSSEKMARNFTRSSSGSLSSSARSSSRAPKSSHDSSRLVNRW